MNYLPLGIQKIISGGKEKFSLSVDVEKQAKKDRFDSGHKEWTSQDGTRKIEISVVGGRDYEGTWMKDVYLYSIGQMEYGIGGGEMMRVQQVIEPDGTTEHNIYLDVRIDQMADLF